MKTPTPIHKLLGSENNELASLITRAKKLSALTHKIRPLLEKSMANHVSVASLDENQLLLAVDTAVWATRLRFEIPNLLALARKSLPECRAICSIKICVLPGADPNPTDQTKQDPAALLSEKNADLIKQLAESTSDETLRAALLRLARHSV